MNIAIIGGRDFDDYNKVKNVVLNYLEDAQTDIKSITVISGGAKGADTLAAKFAHEFHLKINEIIPEWSKYQKAAGRMRNHDIIQESDVIFAFWNGQSKGTKHSISLAKKYKKTCIVTLYTNENCTIN